MYRITAIINKAGGAPVSWTYYSEHRLTQMECEKKLSRDKEAGIHNGFRVRLTEFCCEKANDDVRGIQQTARRTRRRAKHETLVRIPS